MRCVNDVGTRRAVSIIPVQELNAEVNHLLQI
jgi:hypothetical protein